MVMRFQSINCLILHKIKKTTKTIIIFHLIILQARDGQLGAFGLHSAPSAFSQPAHSAQILNICFIKEQNKNIF